MAKNRIYTREFRREAVRMVVEGKRSMRSVAKALGVSDGAIFKWKKQFEAEVASGLNEGEREELVRLRKEVVQLREEREILKKAAAFFARESE